MPLVYFSNLPLSVASNAFRDAISKALHNTSADANKSPFTFHLALPNKPTAGLKNLNGAGSVDFRDDTIIQEFLAQLKTEPIMFGSEAVLFSREAPIISGSSSSHNAPAQDGHRGEPRPAKQTSKETRVSDSGSSRRSSDQKMNLTKSKVKLRPERRGPRLSNPQYERKLQHRLSALGQYVRLERIEFGVRRGEHFSVEYSRNVLESGGDFSFQDDEKSLRIIMGGTQQDHLMPSIVIAIQNVNYVALGSDRGIPYLFLELLQNPHFELGNTARPSTGNAKEDVRQSRTRHSALDPTHRRVAPYTSRWIKMSFYADGFDRLGFAGLCALAGLPYPDLNPQLKFYERLGMYSQDNINTLLEWLQGGSLPWEVAFQCEALFRNGMLVPKELLLLRPLVERLLSESPTHACDILKSFRAEFEGGGARKTFIDFQDECVVAAFEEHIEKVNKAIPPRQSEAGSSKSSFMCHHVKVTPTAVFLTGPFAEQSNRVIRRYPGFESHFIRVGFTDEGDSRARFDFEVDTNAFSLARIGRFLKSGPVLDRAASKFDNESIEVGLRIGNRHYAILGYSQSGFRDHACFFSSDFQFNNSTVTPESIRSSLGSFTKVIHCPARYGARMSQAFSSTDPSVVLPESVIKRIPDLKTKIGDLEFSDGCGTISRDLAEEVWDSMVEQMPHTRRRQRHTTEPTPCAFQIRIGGSKGMVRMDPKLEGRQLCLRPSMTKFEAPGELGLEIARAFERPSPCFLNRPLIMLMWTGGVESAIFEKLMADALQVTISGMQTFAGAARQLVTNRLGRPFRLANTFERLARLGLKPDQPGVRTVGLRKLMNAGLYHIKVGLKHKARIPVPQGHTLVGVCDEDNYLLPRTIYACVQFFDHTTEKTRRQYMHGRMLVTRSPYIHPGDAQILYGIGEPPVDSPFAGEGNHLPNCVIFSSRGDRPVPNMLGGGDLDGDLYNLIPVPELIPPHIYAPASYPAAVLKKIPTESTIDDVADFMIEYICNDNVAMIAVNHLVIASSADMGARDENCMVNARLHNRAVDFVKTGFCVANHEIRKPKYDRHIDPETGMGLRPDWQAGHGRDPADGRYFECPSVLGHLFRAVQLPLGNPAREPVEAPRAPTAVQKLLAKYVAVYHKQIKETFGEATPWVQALLLRYIFELNHICVAHTASSESSERVSEVEVMLGTNLETASDGKNIIERMKRLTDDLASFVRSELRSDEDDSPHDWLARSWCAYLHTSNLGDEMFGALSFSWIALGSVLDALHTLDENFLPYIGPIVPPIVDPPATTPLEANEDSDKFIQADFETWAWEDDPKAAEAKKDGASHHRHRNGRSNGNQSGQRGGDKMMRGHRKKNRGEYPRGGGSESRGRGWDQAALRSSLDRTQPNGSSSRGRTSANGSSRGRAA